MSHRVRAEIDLSAIRHNLGVIRRFVGPGPRMLAVVKANAYGLGATTVARTAYTCGCSALGVNDAEEALELRESGVAGSILVMGATFASDVAALLAADVTITVHSDELLNLIDTTARRQNKVARVHLKVDTGMTRLGAPADQALEVAWAISEYPRIAFEGVFTHLSSAVSGDASVTRTQLDRFERVLAELAHAGLRPPTVHAANSAALFAVPASRYDMVRPGIALFGMDPGIFASMGLDLRPALSLRTRIVHLRGVPAGTTVGYEQTHVTSRETVIATCPVGYDDGYPWQLGNRGTILIRGHRAPIVGRISMNYLMADVGAIPDAQLGDDVTLIGRDGKEEIRVEELARTIGTIPYELTCRLGRRVKRVYTDADELPIAGGMLKTAVI